MHPGGAALYYLVILGIYFCVDALAALGLNLQYGVAGIINFAFIVFEAAGAYGYALTTLGAPNPLLGESYVGGAHLPFPVPYIVAAAVGAAFAALLGPIGLRRIRRDYQAALMISVGIILDQFVSTYQPFLNGAAGLSNIPKPLEPTLGLGQVQYSLVYLGASLAILAAGYGAVTLVTRSRSGLLLRAIREDDEATMISGLNPLWPRFGVFILGGALGGLAGGMLVGFVGAWSPSGWTYAETLVLFVAILLGGTGTNRGTVLGALLVGVVFQEGVQFLPPIGYPGLTDQLQWVATGIIWILVLWFRPRGILPERPMLQRKEVLREPVGAPALDQPAPLAAAEAPEREGGALPWPR